MQTKPHTGPWQRTRVQDTGGDGPFPWQQEGKCRQAKVTQYRGSSSPNSDSSYIPVKGKARSPALQGGWGQYKLSKKLKEIETFAFFFFGVFYFCVAGDQSQDPIPC